MTTAPQFERGGYYVWSSGLQEWERIVVVSWTDIVYLYSKSCSGLMIGIYKDPTGRYLATSVEKT